MPLYCLKLVEYITYVRILYSHRHGSLAGLAMYAQRKEDGTRLADYRLRTCLWVDWSAVLGITASRVCKDWTVSAVWPLCLFVHRINALHYRRYLWCCA